VLCPERLEIKKSQNPSSVKDTINGAERGPRAKRKRTNGKPLLRETRIPKLHAKARLLHYERKKKGRRKGPGKKTKPTRNSKRGDLALEAGLQLMRSKEGRIAKHHKDQRTETRSVRLYRPSEERVLPTEVAKGQPGARKKKKEHTDQEKIVKVDPEDCVCAQIR